MCASPFGEAWFYRTRSMMHFVSHRCPGHAKKVPVCADLRASKALLARRFFTLGCIMSTSHIGASCKERLNFLGL